MIGISPRHPLRRPGFTLIELMVVVGIIVLLVAIAFPVIGKAIASGKRARTQADMGVIQTALEEYKKDHGGRYPQSEGLNSGFAVLARELVGVYGDGLLPGPPPQAADPNDPPAFGGACKPGEAVNVGGKTYVAMVDSSNFPPNLFGPPPTTAVWADVNCHDYEDGPGSRVAPGGKKVSYIPPDRLHVRGCALLDQEDKPILYFPAHGNQNISVASAAVPEPYVSLGGNGKFDANDNVQFFTRWDDQTTNPDALNRIRVLLGDKGNGSGGLPNGRIDGDESAVATGRYILWAAGPDGFYGVKTKVSTTPPTPAEIAKCDDILLTSP